MTNPIVRFTISTRLLLLIGIIAVGMGGILHLSTIYIRDALFDKYIEQTQHLVQTAYSLLTQCADKITTEGASLEEAQTCAITLIGNLRYGKDEYFWINNMDGVMLVHPLKGMAGKNIFDDKDITEKYLTRSVIDIVKKYGEGHDTYYWPPNEKNAKMKISYFMGFPKWGWIVGTGTYVEQIETEINDILIKLISAASFLVLISLLIASIIGRSISKPIVDLNGVMRELAAGNLDIDVKPNSRMDEIGSMAQTVQIFVENARRIARIETEKSDMENMKSEFISVVSHELRTPLTSIRGALGLIAGTMAKDMPEKAAHLIQIAYINCDRLMTLINDLLDIDKAAAGELHFDMRHEKLAPIMSQAIETNRSYAEKYFVRLSCDPLPDSIEVNVDKARLLQVLSNLLSNAAKFSPAGGKVRLYAETDTENVRINVSDYGLGIPEEFRSRVFQKFSQAESSSTRKKGGTGLGLHISKNLVELMGGQIGFDSTVGLGSTFWVEFPMIKHGAKT
ncbi:MAG: cache domain-containing protein [Alphaproteobacteria bacterium]|nr:cache domain-containing protein [Alphaproteobacteria bacterium]